MSRLLKHLFVTMLLTFFPLLSMAASGDSNSLSFTPPASDFSVVFLANIFGIVDGVLNGNGSQIMGVIFGVFNGAVLALGGMIIMYTLIVSTMNTAHEGQFLGQKFSSIWIPVRTTLGLTLMIPKASGYCLMQIFVMWIVVQGVGAADKIWNATLGYLNRGGVVVQAQMSPTRGLTSAGASGLQDGAQLLLAGQVCMAGLQAQLQKQLRWYQSMKQSQHTGPCNAPQDTDMINFCNTTNVPDFINTVNFVDAQNKMDNGIGIFPLPNAERGAPPPTPPPLIVTMPNFLPGSIYTPLNGLCGKVQWNRIPNLNSIRTSIPNFPAADFRTVSMSRAIAIQQMYLDLSTIAQKMVSNNPAIGKNNPQNESKPKFSAMAIEQFGVPLTPSGSVCPNNEDSTCVLWGSLPTYEGVPLLNGTEFLGAIQDYDGIMMPTLSLLDQVSKGDNAASLRAFIRDATNQGWIMAGSYFFDIVALNVKGNESALNGGLRDRKMFDKDETRFDSKLLLNTFGEGSKCQTDAAILCKWLGPDNVSLLYPILMMINGEMSEMSTTSKIPTVGVPELESRRNTIIGIASSTVYGYTNNSTILKLPGQPGMEPLKFANEINLKIDDSTTSLPKMNFDCGAVNFGLVKPCFGRIMGDFYYNFLLRNVYNIIIAIASVFIKKAIIAFLILPLTGMAAIFKAGLNIISTPGASPIVALAQMGTFYINFVMDLWIDMLQLSIIIGMLPLGLGLVLFAIMAMVAPLLMAWMGIMIGIGFSTAYYVPMLPYMIFTFGAIAWLMAVIEAMVAAPIVALGITYPEGHEAFGKGESAIMILMNIFLRPSMMIIGFIAAISLSYVGVWVLNAGFDNAIGFIQGSDKFGTKAASKDCSGISCLGDRGSWTETPAQREERQKKEQAAKEALEERKGYSGNYDSWAGVFAYFFSILIYTMIYITLVQKSFTLIAVLPDKVLRWIGVTQENQSSETAQWGQEVQNKVSEAGKDTTAAGAQMAKTGKAMGDKLANKAKQGAKSLGGGNVSAKAGPPKDEGKKGA